MAYSGCEEVSENMDNPSDLVIDFVNTYDVESDTDAIPTPAALAAWLGKRGLIGPGDTADEGDLTTAVALRESLRSALRHNHDNRASGRRDRDDQGDRAGNDRGPDDAGPGGNGAHGGHAAPPEVPEAARVFAAIPLRVALTPGGPVLEPVETGVPGGLARIVAAVMGTHADGMWPRLKVCTESTCQWAFVDSSKNRSRSWCSMRVCGNRTKTRAYRARRQAETGSRHPRVGFPDTV
ncbi:CGNR zinc finger domain-containing protein [Streptosporangium fragile]|uniref:CGNR zinc finger domain-containing protein n=1 Tax=Streptosporangium fragile TaxID=46186 RepID=A0ABN3WCX2_9ACTN